MPNGNLRAASTPLRGRGFTIIEMLVVLGIISILAAILIPTLTGATVSAKKAKTRVQFAQWITAIEGFRQEYGFYPDFVQAGFGTLPFGGDGIINSATDARLFVETLSGRRLDGTALDDDDPAPNGWDAGNTKGIAFCSFSTNELIGSPPQVSLQDAFGNPEIVCLIDSNYDGMIRFADPNEDYSSLPQVKGLAPPPPPGNVIRASVIFYSPGAGQSASDIVKSWE